MSNIDYAVARSKFEAKARSKGFHDFERRGSYYNVSELNTLWDGYLMALGSN